MCGGHPAVAALPHVASTVDAFLLNLSPKWTLLRATDSGFVHLLGRLLTQAWEGLSPDFRQARFERCVDRGIRSTEPNVLAWWMTKYLPGQEDFVVKATIGSGKIKMLQWLYDQGKLPLDHPGLRMLNRRHEPGYWEQSA